MKVIKLFLASSNELKSERDQFEIEIYRKCKMWIAKGIFLYLDIWEDLSARMSQAGSQSEYNKFVMGADIFILLAYSKLGMYTDEEFENAFGQFKSTQKPFIFTYFKNSPANTEDSLGRFKQKLNELKHFYANFDDSNDLWNQFNKELDRLEAAEFKEFVYAGNTNSSTITGNDNMVIQGNSGTVNINTGNTTNQSAKSIINIEKLDYGNFS